MRKLGQLAGALALTGALAAPVQAQENTSGVVLAAAEGTNTQVTDCVGFVREQRILAQENDTPMSRRSAMTLLAECENEQMAERIAEQELILAALDEQIGQYDLRLDEQNRIIDVNNQEIARIVAINGQLIIQRRQVQTETAALNADTARLDADTEAKLREAERILQSLATS